MNRLTEKCPACGKFVSDNEGYTTPDWPDWEFAPFRACCNKACSDIFESRYPQQVKEWEDCSKVCEHTEFHKAKIP
jgi:hypothetical protein